MNTRIMAFADLHNRFDRFRPEKLPDADIAIVAGDITHTGALGLGEPGAAHALNYALSLVSAHQWMEALADKYGWVFYVLGNHDALLAETVFDTKPDKRPPWCLSVHQRVGGHDWFQIVGSSLTPCFDRPGMTRQHHNVTTSKERDANEWEAMHPLAQIIVSHAPPLGVLDLALADKGGPARHIGSPGLLAYIEKNQPRLVVCGHVHNAVGIQYVGQTCVINTACSATLITVPESGEIEAEILG